ncbi:MAG: sigma 54-interacting transcriptional regulator [Desulfobacteraceae bacterium]|nr:sigma 54-interacting transcriptional regulator [Desulfobacteraceae bacterium]
MNKKTNDVQLDILTEISRIVEQALNLDQALEAVLGILSDFLPMQTATVTLKDDESGRFLIRASHGLTTAERKRGGYLPGQGVAGLIYRAVQPFLVQDEGKEPLFFKKTIPHSVERHRISLMGVPIFFRGSSIGVISVDRLFDDDVPIEEDIRFLTVLSAIVAQFVSLNRQVRMREERLRKENLSLRTELSEKYNNFFMVAKSPAMLEAQQRVRKIAPGNTPVLLWGESGTGKTLIARIIHEMSGRSGHPFIEVNCAGLPEGLLEPELFGYEKKNLSGDVKAKSGRFEDAKGGTILLNNVSELSTSLQARLVPYLEQRELKHAGARGEDVRIIAATDRDLSQTVAEGTFRQDLHQFLCAFPIILPPLRERAEDIPLLINYSLERASKEYGRKLHLTHHAMDMLKKYSWPGNVRELESFMERLALTAEEQEIDVKDFPPYFHLGGGHPVANRTERLSRLEEMEKKEVVAALERNGWVQSRAAKDLGLTLRQVGYRIKKFGLERLVERRRSRIYTFRKIG